MRYYDKAGTDASDNADAAFTAGVRMHAMSDGTYVISHIMRGQWAALERETKIKTCAEAEGICMDGISRTSKTVNTSSILVVASIFSGT